VNPTASGAATQVYSRKFDERFFALSAEGQRHVQHRIDEMGRRLASFPHYRMEGTDTFRLRVGDYRVIYQFDVPRNEIFLIALGHRRDIYKQR
jgi:mRNA-degrading endonuclease RelE of RelBE toxin-antitoxin system